MFLFGFSKLENIFIKTDKKIEKQTVTLWCNVSFNDQEFMSGVQWIEREHPLRASNLEYLNSSTIKRINIALHSWNCQKMNFVEKKYIDVRLQQKIMSIIKLIKLYI